MQLPVNPLFSSPKQDWLSACQSLEQRGEAYCIATIVAESGSLPRGVGAKIVVSSTHQFDTLGGGALEFDIIHKARAGLMARQSNANISGVHIERFALAADLGQCCGGAAQVMFEYLNTQLAHVVVFGAGHVCQSLAAILKALPCHLQVIDSRENWLESFDKQGIATALYKDTAEAVAEIPANSHLVIMTHEHSQDFEITRRALERKCFPFIGLIASTSKKKRFEFRLKEQLSTTYLLEQLTCPIGHPNIKGKLPMQVAVSIAAQLMTYFEQKTTQNAPRKAMNKNAWENVNQLRTTLLAEKNTSASKPL
ncbi:MAG: xanthine dehydrogenase accessory protein XdhC [Colwellia sp.]